MSAAMEKMDRSIIDKRNTSYESIGQYCKLP